MCSPLHGMIDWGGYYLFCGCIQIFIIIMSKFQCSYRCSDSMTKNELSYYDSYGCDDRLIFNDCRTQMECISKTIMPVYFYSRLNGIHGDSGHDCDRFDDALIEKIMELNDYIYNIPESTSTKQQDLVVESIRWVKGECPSERTGPSEDKDRLEDRIKRNKARIKIFKDGVSRGIVTPAMGYARNNGQIPVSLTG